MTEQENTLQVPQEILDAARISIPELRVELALMLYEQKRLSIGKARELAGMTLWEFRQVLGARRIMPHYQATELREDVETLKNLDHP
jgi:predicted HTH domain antitoxin